MVVLAALGAVVEETDPERECVLPAKPVDRGDPASGPCRMESEGDEDEPAVEDDRTVLLLNGWTGLMFGRRMAIGPDEGDEDNDEREGLEGGRSRMDDEGEWLDPRLSFRKRETPRPERPEDGDWAPMKSPVASCLGGWTGLPVLAVRAGRMNRSATSALVDEAAFAMFLGGDRVILLIDESRWWFFVRVGTNPSPPSRSCDINREDSTDSNSSN